MRHVGIRSPLAILVCLLAIGGLGAAKPPRAEDCEYWVAPPPTGDDENPGSYNSPWATLKHASRSVPDAHCTIWFFPGVYAGGTRLNRRFETPTAFRSMDPYQAVLRSDGAVLSISGAKNITLEGFDIHHSGPSASPLLIAIDGAVAGWSEYITLRDNIIHDSYNNDLLKIYNLSRFITVENNVLYNQGPGEEHMDINSVTDVTVQDNIFFNDYEASGRRNDRQSKQFIVIKDSNGPEDGLLGSQRVTVRRNIFLNWEGQEDETFIQVGLDGKPYYEAMDVHIENNLLIGNSQNPVGAAFGVRGAKDVYFVNNTVSGDLPSSAYAMRVTITEQNPRNQHIYFFNNVWSDPTGTMGADQKDGPGEFSHGRPQDTQGLVLSGNLYWNGGVPIPGGNLISPIPDDEERIIGNPRVTEDQSALLVPHWDGEAFLSGNLRIRDEFVRLVREYGATSVFSPGRDRAASSFAPPDDILGEPRLGHPDLGAYEYPHEPGCGSWLCRNLQEF
jgi:hypothetical protein